MDLVSVIRATLTENIFALRVTVILPVPDAQMAFVLTVKAMVMLTSFLSVSDVMEKAYGPAAMAWAFGSAIVCMCLTVFAILVKALAGVLPVMEKVLNGRWVTELVTTAIEQEFVVPAMVLKSLVITALPVM